MKELLPLIIIIGLKVLFKARQSSHPWNTASFCTTKYFPTDGKSLADAAFLQNYNALYAGIKYGETDAKDWYFTNPEVFKGASTTLGAIKANPKFVMKQWWRNIRSLPHTSLRITSIPTLWSAIVKLFKLPIHGGVILYPLSVLLIICSAMKQTKRR